jgi:hypothetical protein
MRRALILLLLAALGLGIAAHLTRPGEAELAAQIEAAVRERVANTDLDASGDPVATVALAACKLRPSDCADLVRGVLDVRMERGPFATRAVIGGFGRETRCLGVFGRFFCRRPERA